MRTLFATIGILLCGTWLFQATPLHAMESASYTLESAYNSDTTVVSGASPTISLQGDVSWRQAPLASNSFAIVPVFTQGTQVSSSSSLSSTTSGVSSSSSSTTSSSINAGGHRSSSSSVSSESSLSFLSSLSSASSLSFSFHSSAHSSATSSSSHSSKPKSSSSSSFKSVASVSSWHRAAGASSVSSSASSSSAQSYRSRTASSKSSMVCRTVVVKTPPPASGSNNWRVMLGAVGGALIAIGFFPWKGRRLRSRRKQDDVSRVRIARILAVMIGVTFLLIALNPRVLHAIVPAAHAEQTVPATRIYNGHLLSSSGQPITSPHTIRFSQWKSADFVSATDLTVTGAINTSAPNYLGWQETHTVTPDSSGYFSVTLGEQSPLPEAFLSGNQLLLLFLQVDVKTAAAPDSSYEEMDVNPADPAIDRSQIYPISLARNADFLDQHDTGTGSGNIAVLGAGGTFNAAQMGNGTNADAFTIDSDNSATGALTLQFGAALAKKITYDTTQHLFNFNDSVRIQGDLTVTGLVNGVNISSLQSATGALKAESGGGLKLLVSMGNYRLNGVNHAFAGSGDVLMYPNATNYVFFTTAGLSVSTSGFPTDQSYIPVAQVVTTSGSISSVIDARALQSDDRESTVLHVLHPAYEGASFQADGNDNVGQLALSTDNINLKNFYMWTSTKPTLQDYDIIVRVSLSPGFKQWTASGITLAYRSTSGSMLANKADIQVYDTNGIPVSLVGASSNLASTTWTKTTLTFSGTPTWTKGQEFLIRIKVSARNNEQMHIGDLKLHYSEMQSP